MPTCGRRSWEWAAETVDTDHARLTIVVDSPRHDDWGAWARNYGLATLNSATTHVAFLDDDDAHTFGAAVTMLEWIACEPDALHIGRLIGDDGETVVAWTEEIIRKGQVATPCIVAPAWAARAVEWETVYDQDWRWARDVAELVPSVVWHTESVAQVRPWGRL